MKIFPERTWKGVGLALLRIMVLCYIFFGLLLYLRQDAYIYFPDPTPFTDCPPFIDATQVNMGGTRGYYFQHGTSTKLAVLYHGNAGRACDRAYFRATLERAGYSWLFVEYAGYAETNGVSPSTERVIEDVRRVAAWVKENNFAPVAVIGESVGSGPASYHALLGDPEKLIFITPFDSLRNVAQGHFPAYPARLMLSNDFDNVTWARGAGRVLIIHGTDDTTIPMTRSKVLFDALPQKDKRYVEIPQAGHNDVLDNADAWTAIGEFLDAP